MQAQEEYILYADVACDWTGEQDPSAAKEHCETASHRADHK